MTKNISMQEREDCFSSHLEVVDANFSKALYTFVDKYGETSTADELKSAAITLYTYTWHDHFRVFIDDSFIGLAIRKIEFPPTFDEIVDRYIEMVKGCKPTFSYKEVIDVIEESKTDMLGLFFEKE